MEYGLLWTISIFLFLAFFSLLKFYKMAYRRGYHSGATDVLNDWKWHMGIGFEPERDEELPKNVVRIQDYREHDYYDE